VAYAATYSPKHLLLTEVSGGVERLTVEGGLLKISDFLHDKAVCAELKAVDKVSAIKELVSLLVAAGSIRRDDQQTLVETLSSREELGSTGIGQGVGIPHGKSDSVKDLVAAFGRSVPGVDFDSLDGEPVHLFFLLVAPNASAGPHLKALARISRLLKDKYFREALKSARDDKDILRIIKEEDAKRQ